MLTFGSMGGCSLLRTSECHAQAHSSTDRSPRMVFSGNIFPTAQAAPKSFTKVPVLILLYCYEQTPNRRDNKEGLRAFQDVQLIVTWSHELGHIITVVEAILHLLTDRQQTRRYKEVPAWGVVPKMQPYCTVPPTWPCVYFLPPSSNSIILRIHRLMNPLIRLEPPQFNCPWKHYCRNTQIQAPPVPSALF